VEGTADGQHGRGPWALQTLYGAIFVKGVPQGSYPISRPSVSLFDLAAVSSSRPTHLSGRRAQERSRLAAHRAATDRLGLDGSEHDGTLAVVGMTTSEGSCEMVHERTCHILVCGGPKAHTMMQ
jgi:hypothetical protein